MATKPAITPYELRNLICRWNDLTNPATFHSQSEHESSARHAKTIKLQIQRNYREGIDYRELSNGMLWPIEQSEVTR